MTALPGTYTVKMTVAGQSYSQPLTVKMDPRIKTSAAELQKQFDAATAVAHSQSEISRRTARSAAASQVRSENFARKRKLMRRSPPHLDALIQKAERHRRTSASGPTE